MYIFYRVFLHQLGLDISSIFNSKKLQFSRKTPSWEFKKNEWNPGEDTSFLKIGNPQFAPCKFPLCVGFLLKKKMSKNISNYFLGENISTVKVFLRWKCFYGENYQMGNIPSTNKDYVDFWCELSTMGTVCPAELNIGPFGTCPSPPPGWPGLGPPNWTLGRRIFSQNSKISFKSGRLIKFAHSWFTTFEKCSYEKYPITNFARCGSWDFTDWSGFFLLGAT